MGRIFRRTPRQLVLPGVRVPRKGRRERAAMADLGPIARARMHLVTAPVTRRRFLAGTLGWVSAAIAAALGIPAGAAVVSPLFRKDEEGWSPVARLGKPDPGDPDLRVENEPILTHVTSLVEDAYLKASPRDAAIYVVNRGGEQFTVFDVRCTHLGCPVTWKEGDGEFFSPCHGGVFDAEGRVLEGPPPRPLDRYEYKVEGGVLYVGKLYQVNDELQRVTF
jgi:Rieske Fe-S protein